MSQKCVTVLPVDRNALLEAGKVKGNAMAEPTMNDLDKVKATEGQALSAQ